MHAATSKVENSAQGSSCKLKFVHELMLLVSLAILMQKEKKYTVIKRSSWQKRVSKFYPKKLNKISSRCLYGGGCIRTSNLRMIWQAFYHCVIANDQNKLPYPKYLKVYFKISIVKN